MTEAPQTDLLRLLSFRERQCKIERRALEMWLGALTPLRWFTTAGSIVLTTFAAATGLGTRLFSESWTIVGGACALVAAILTGLHTGFDCDAHQSECRRLIQLYSSLEAAYQNLIVMPPAERLPQYKALEEKFNDARTMATASAPSSYKLRAEREIRTTTPPNYSSLSAGAATTGNEDAI
jgi:hypothetical protein